MKRILLFVLTCGLLLCCLAQTPVSNIESSNAWTVKPGKGVPKTKGRLELNFPPGVDWSVDVYNSAKKFITNHSLKDQRNADDKKNYYDLAPGIYHFKLNSVMVENVPIEEGKITRIRSGVMDVSAPDKWELRTGAQNKFLTSGNKPKKFALPTGIYILKTGSDVKTIEINDGVPEPSQNTDVAGEDFVMSPNEEDQGRLITRFPEASQNGFFAIFYPIRIHKAGETNPVHVCGGSNSAGQACPPHYPLADGTYDISFGVGGNGQTLNPIKLISIPVKKGFETRMKVGYLIHRTKGIYHLYDALKQTRYSRYDQQGAAPMPVPAGSYLLEMPGVGEFRIEIRDEKTTTVSPHDSIASPGSLWTVRNAKNEAALNDKGRLTCSFSKAEAHKLRLAVKKPDGTNEYINLDAEKFHDAAPGTYKVRLNDVDVEIPIKTGSVTSIRHGYVKVEHTGDVLWEIEPVGAGTNSCFAKDNKMRALPIGLYKLKVPSVSGAVREYYFRIHENEMISVNPDFHYDM